MSVPLQRLGQDQSWGDERNQEFTQQPGYRQTQVPKQTTLSSPPRFRRQSGFRDGPKPWMSSPEESDTDHLQQKNHESHHHHHHQSQQSQSNQEQTQQRRRNNRFQTEEPEPVVKRLLRGQGRSSVNAHTQHTAFEERRLFATRNSQQPVRPGESLSQNSSEALGWASDDDSGSDDFDMDMQFNDAVLTDVEKLRHRHAAIIKHHLALDVDVQSSHATHGPADDFGGLNFDKSFQKSFKAATKKYREVRADVNAATTLMRNISSTIETTAKDVPTVGSEDVPSQTSGDSRGKDLQRDR